MRLDYTLLYMKKENRNWIAWIALGLSVIAIIISIAAICITCPHVPELGFDYQGVLVGTLSLLVTALIGWQIYNYISLKSEMEKRMTEIVNERLEKLNYAVIGYAKARLSNATFMKAIPTNLDNAFEALEDIILSENIDSSNVALNCAINKIVGAIEDIKSSNQGILKIYPNKKNHYLKLMKSIEHEDKDDVIAALKDAEDMK